MSRRVGSLLPLLRPAAATCLLAAACARVLRTWHARRAGREAAWTALTVLVTAGLCALWFRPDFIGQWGDDALYLSAAESFADRGELLCTALPFTPMLAKYPPGYPLALGMTFRVAGSAARTGMLAGVHAALLVSTMLILIVGFGRRLALRTHERLALLGLAGTNTSLLAVCLAPMSEALYLPLLLLCALGAGESVTWERRRRPGGIGLRAVSSRACRGILLGLGAGALVLVRSIGVVMAPALVPAVLARGRRWQAVAILAGVGAGMVATGVFRGEAGKANRALPAPAAQALRYYLDYRYHADYYRAIGSAAGPSAVVRGAIGLAIANARLGALAVTEVLLPVRKAEAGLSAGAGAPSGVLAAGGLALLALAGSGLAHRRLRWLLGLPAASCLCLLLFWPWPPGPRFWVPLLPALILGAIFGCRRLGRPGTLGLWALVAASCATHGAIIVERHGVGDVRAAIAAAATALSDPVAGAAAGSGDAALFLQTAWLQRAGDAARGDVLAGGFAAPWVGRLAGLQSLWLDSILRPEVLVPELVHGAGGLDRPPGAAGDPVARLAGLARELPREARLFVLDDGTLVAPMQAALSEIAHAGRLRRVGVRGVAHPTLYELLR